MQRWKDKNYIYPPIIFIKTPIKMDKLWKAVLFRYCILAVWQSLREGKQGDHYDVSHKSFQARTQGKENAGRA